MIRNPQRLIAAAMIVIQCLLVGQLTGGYGFSLSSIVIATLLVWVSISVPSVLYCILVVVSVVVVSVTTASQPLEIPTDWLLPGQFVAAACQVLIVAQMLELLRTVKSEPVSIRFGGMVLLSLMIAFCRVETDDNSVLFYAVAVVMIWLIALLGTQKQSGVELTDADPKRKPVARFALAAFLLVALAGGTGYFANTAKGATGLLRYFISQRVSDVIAGENAIVAFTASGNLGSVNKLKQDMPDKVVVDVTCDFRPGYLRGRVFTEFDDNRWERGREVLSSCQRVTPGKMVTIPTVAALPRILDDVFAVDLETRNAEPFRFIEVTNREQLIGDVFFSTLNCDFIVGSATTVDVDQDDVVYSDTSPQRPTRYYVARDQNRRDLKKAYRDALLVVNERTRENLSGIAAEVCDGAVTFDDKVVAVESFFRNNFKYSMNPFFSRRSDRISDFVINRRAAHCEYFATAAAMLLRLSDVPTRYVTGFTVEQQFESDDNDGEMWIARNRDAHAWVEAFDEQSMQWRIVEATPGVDVPRGLWLQRGSRLNNGLRIENDSNESKSFGDSFLAWFDSFWRIYSGVGQWLTTAVNMLLLCAVPYMVYRFYLRAVRKHVQYGIRSRSARLRKLDRRLAKVNLVRKPSETLHQFANRILESSLEQNWIEEAADEYCEYAERRYSMS